MNKILKNELYKAFVNKKFLLVLLMESLLILWYTIGEVIPLINDYVEPWNEMIYNRTYPDKMANTLPLGAYYIWIGHNYCKHWTLLYAVLPIFAAIPYGASAYVEKNSHYSYHFLMKTGKVKYYAAKLVALFLSGGTIAMFPFLLSFLISAGMLPLEQVSILTHETNVPGSFFAELYYKSPFIYVLVFLVLTFLCYGIFNCFCFVATHIMDNKFVVTIFPFALYYTTRVIDEVFLGKMLAPWFAFRIRDVSIQNAVPIAIEIILIVLIIASVYMFKCRRKGDEL